MSSKIKKKNKPQIVIDRNMRDYSNDAGVLKKTEEAAAFLKVHGLPKEIEERIKKKNV